ncbi:MAG: DUF4139 domain-containing protein [Abitibacteriaceae bacterium]|nr:DUF4139 domain-containing protein [Abditibacteriaceae bacterium]MBV9865273.1 DUF4139 domain-containing protein [Abditibacteriaceae bacterium]
MKRASRVTLTAIAGAFTLTWARWCLAEPALTIYNQNFAVVRDTVPLDLQRGINHISVNDTTAFVEPDSVVLRDPAGQRKLQVLEQNYRSDPATQEKLLSLYEGQTIDFLVPHKNSIEIVRGKIVRSGYAIPISQSSNYGGSNPSAASNQPLLEVDGKLRFALPGTPLFPTLPADTILKPTLNWSLNADQAGPLNAELSYVTGGMNWEADYNIVSPEQGDVLEMVGWVTFKNQSGKSFENARVKLMAGKVNKVQLNAVLADTRPVALMGFLRSMPENEPTVTEKAFDEYHLYNIVRPVTLRDRETKQVEFVRAEDIKSQRIYVYDGAKLNIRNSDYYNGQLRDPSYGTGSNPRVWVMREFKNSTANGLGLPLPQGRVRFYQRDTNGQLEFTGENTIDHTPKDETLSIYTGDAFDIVGERKQTAYKVGEQRSAWADESFEIKLRNHKAEQVQVRVVEHLYRGLNWKITAKSNATLKTDSTTVEFRVQVPPKAEKIITYTVHYKW